MSQYFNLYPNGKVRVSMSAELPPEIDRVTLQRLTGLAIKQIIKFDAEEFVRRLMGNGVPEESARKCAETLTFDDDTWLDEIGARGG